MNKLIFMRFNEVGKSYDEKTKHMFLKAVTFEKLV